VALRQRAQQLLLFAPPARDKGKAEHQLFRAWVAGRTACRDGTHNRKAGVAAGRVCVR
jgi:hypothetical protein